MPATTSPITKPSTRTREEYEAPTAKPEAFQIAAANNQPKNAQNQHSVATVSAVAEEASQENVKTPARVMVQAADQWRNCQKPHRI